MNETRILYTSYMNELTIDGKTYVSSKRAAEITGYAKDYIGQLCREGRITAKLVGRSWYVLESAIREHRFGAKDETKAAPRGEVADVSSTWDAPVYRSEVPQHLPDMPQKATAHAVQGQSRQDASTLTAMHDAWQEWFSLKQAPKQAPELLLADHEELPVAQVGQKAEDVRSETESDHKDQQEADRVAEVVPMTRIASPEPSQASRYADAGAVPVSIDRIRPVPRRMRPVEAFTAHEEAVREELIEDIQGTSVFTVTIRTLLVLVVAIAIGVGIIGSGVAESYMTKIGVTRYVNAISGAIEYSR